MKNKDDFFLVPLVFQCYYLLFVLTGDVDVLCAVVERNFARAAAQDGATLPNNSRGPRVLYTCAARILVYTRGSLNCSAAV